MKEIDLSFATLTPNITINININTINNHQDQQPRAFNPVDDGVVSWDFEDLVCEGDILIQCKHVSRVCIYCSDY